MRCELRQGFLGNGKIVLKPFFRFAVSPQRQVEVKDAALEAFPDCGRVRFVVVEKQFQFDEGSFQVARKQCCADRKEGPRSPATPPFSIKVPEKIRTALGIKARFHDLSSVACQSHGGHQVCVDVRGVECSPTGSHGAVLFSAPPISSGPDRQLPKFPNYRQDRGSVELHRRSGPDPSRH